MSDPSDPKFTSSAYVTVSGPSSSAICGEGNGVCLVKGTDREALSELLVLEDQEVDPPLTEPPRDHSMLLQSEHVIL